MGEIHATINISLDGCCDDAQVIADDEFHERISDLFDEPTALLFGSKTFALLHGYWPGVASRGDGTPGVLRLAHILNRKPKYVVSVVIPRPIGKHGVWHQLRMRLRHCETKLTARSCWWQVQRSRGPLCSGVS